MTTKQVRLLILAVITIIVILLVAVALNQLATNNSTKSPISNPSPIPTTTAVTSPSVHPTSTTKPSSTSSLKSPIPQKTATPSPPQATSYVTSNPTIQPTQTPLTTPTEVPTINPTPIPTPVPTPTSTSKTSTVNFDFDTTTSSNPPSISTPFSQTKNGIIAQFSSPSDPAAFSIQNSSTTLYKLSKFSGNYIYDNKPTRDLFEIRFSQPITSITFTFATIENQSSQITQPSTILMVAYLNSILNTVGSTSATGTWPTGGDTFPQGTLTFSPGSSFNLIRIELPRQEPHDAVDYLIDNIIITPISI